MHPIFSISVRDVQLLDDVEARELIARLCRADASRNGLSESVVTWGGDQRAKDGGVDVRIDAPPTRKVNAFIQGTMVAFQVKAEPLVPSRIAAEMAPKGIIRPAIVDLARDGGFYTIASTRDDVSDMFLAKRVTAMEACLKDHGLEGKVAVDFYGSRRIADWVEQHPQVATWMRSVLGKPLQGWKPYGPWAYAEKDMEAAYLIDERAKVFTPNADEGCGAAAAINRLRKDVITQRAVRLVGLSGVGKTRLAQALFDKRIETESPACEADAVLYADVSVQPDPPVESMVAALIADKADCVVVIDNCSQETHRKLVEELARGPTNVRLLTIEYDIRDDLPEGTACYRLEGSSEETIRDLLMTRFPILSHGDIGKIVEASDGNARLAFALASTAETSGELSQLHDDELFRRLFVQKKSDSDELLRCAKTASLVYSFDGDDTSSLSEVAILAELAELSIKGFLRGIAEIERRGLAQRRGKWRALLPHAISNRLASHALDEYPITELVTKLVDHGPERLARSFARRLSYLHESQVARTIVGGWLKEGGRYGDLVFLESKDASLFQLIAPVCPEQALKAIERAAEAPDIASRTGVDLEKLAGVARLIAYDANWFERVVELLLTLANRAHSNAGARRSILDLLKSLFFCHLSGTHATAQQRASIVQRLLDSQVLDECDIGMDLLSAGLEAWQFSCSYPFEFGARKRDYGWAPHSRQDMEAWFSPLIAMAVELGAEDSELGRRARELLGKEVRSLWTRAGMRSELIKAAPHLVAVDGWPDAWISARRILNWDRGNLDPDDLDQLNEFERLVSPKNLRESVIAKVLSRNVIDSFEEGDGEDRFEARSREAAEEAERLGESLAANEPLLLELLPRLMGPHNQGNPWHLGHGVGQSMVEAPKLMSAIRQLLATEEPDKVRTLFLHGALSGWAKVDPEGLSSFLDGAIDDSVWGLWFPELQTSINLDGKGFDRLLSSLARGLTPAYRYGAVWTIARDFSIEQISFLVDAICRHSDDGQRVAIDVLHMIMIGAKEKPRELRESLGKYTIGFLGRLDWSSIDTDRGCLEYELDGLIKSAVKASDSAEELSQMISGVVSFRRNHPRWFPAPRGNFIKPILRRYPKTVLNAVYVPDEDGSYQAAARMLANETGKEEQTAVESVRDEEFIQWCEESPADRYTFAAQTCRLFEVAASGDSALAEVAPSLSSIVLKIIERAPDKSAIVGALVSRFLPTSYTDSEGAVIKQRLALFDAIDTMGNIELAQALKKGRGDLEKRTQWWGNRKRVDQRGREESFE